MNALPTSTLHWRDANLELPRRDVPVIVAVVERGREFCAISHRLSKGWANIKAPAAVVYWAALPPPPAMLEL
jgi:alkylhydroperoxidase family enzyme